MYIEPPIQKIEEGYILVLKSNIRYDSGSPSSKKIPAVTLEEKKAWVKAQLLGKKNKEVIHDNRLNDDVMCLMQDDEGEIHEVRESEIYFVE